MEEIKKRRNVLFNEFKRQNQLKPTVLFIIYRLLSISCGLNPVTYSDSITDTIMDELGLNELCVDQRNQVRNMCNTFRDEFKDRVNVMVNGHIVTYEPKRLQQTTVE